MTSTVYLSAGAGEAEIRSAIYKLGQTGGTVVLPKDADITLTKTLYLNVGSENVTIDLNGSTLHQTGNQNLLTVMGTENPLTTVKLGLDGHNNTTVTYDKLPDNLKVGGYIKVTSDDALPGDHLDAMDAGNATRMGQAAKVVAIEGNTVVLEGQILEQNVYQTNVRATVYSTGQLTVKNGALDGDAPGYNAYSSDLLHVRNLVNPVVENVKFTDSGTGVNFVNTVGALAKDIVATNLWAGVHSSTSLNTAVNGEFAEHVAHGVMVHGIGTVANAASASTFGADIGLYAQNMVVYDARMGAFDFHSESRNGTYANDLAFDSKMVVGLRGIGNTITDSAGAGNERGVQFFEYGQGDGRDATVSNLTLRETKYYTFVVSGNTQDNQVLNSSFESYGAGYKVVSSVATFLNSSIKTGILSDNDVLVGTAAADKLLGGKGTDLVMGGAGDDYIWGGAEKDLLFGGTGHDRFAYHSLSEGGDTIGDFKAGADGDAIDVSVLAARLGWTGDNFLASGYIRAVQSGSDTLIEARDGSNWVNLATLSNVKASTFGLSNLQMKLSDVTPWANSAAASENIAKMAAVVEPVKPTVTGTTGTDIMKDAGVATAFVGSAGDDNYYINSIGSTIAGEAASGGRDSVWAGVSTDMSSFAFVENLRLTGKDNVNATGNAQANVITGNAGNNVIAGGVGNDTLWGKGGADTFFFAEMGTANRDNIWDFGADDKIALSKAVFTGLDANKDGEIDAAAFHIATTVKGGAVGNGPQLVYNTLTGYLSYDDDGAGSHAAQDIAYIGKKLGFFDVHDVLLA